MTVNVDSWKDGITAICGCSGGSRETYDANLGADQVGSWIRCCGGKWKRRLEQRENQSCEM